MISSAMEMEVKLLFINTCPRIDVGFCKHVDSRVNPLFCNNDCKGDWELNLKVIKQAKIKMVTIGGRSSAGPHICVACENFRSSCKVSPFCLLLTRFAKPGLYERWLSGECPIGKWNNATQNSLDNVESSSMQSKSIPDAKPAEVLNIKPAVKSKVIFKRYSGNVVDITDQFKNQTAFLVCNGPSFGLINKTKLNLPGILTMGMNNGPCKSDFRPDLWTAQDPVTKFLPSIWLDPKIMKFALLDFRNKKLFDPHAKKPMTKTLKNCPNLYFHKRHSAFHAHKWFNENKIVWGKPKKDGGNRSTMLAAIQILWLLGISRIYLIGCDFYMDTNTRYHFDEYRGPASIKGNQQLFRNLAKYFTDLLPYMKVNNLEIFNCNERSHLKVFPYKNFDEAIAENEIKLDEPTKGMYANK